MLILSASRFIRGVQATSNGFPCIQHAVGQNLRFHLFYSSAAHRAAFSLSENKNSLYVKSEFLTVHCRSLQTTSFRSDNDPLKPSSKVEESVLAFKEDLKKEQKKLAAIQPSVTPVVAKPSLGKRIMDELKHYYHGFRLLFIDVKISWNLLWRVLKGEMLSRREKKQLVKTSADVFRLVPFSVFIIVPFMEFTLPIFLKLFPNMLPSTFQTANEKEAKMKTELKVKLEMAKFLQQTLDEMALKRAIGSGHQSYTAKEFAEFCSKLRSSGQQASNEEILRFSKLFEDEITLDSLTRPQLRALCRVLELSTIGPNSLLRFQLRMGLRSLAADDKVIQKEGVDSLTVSEMQAACRARGMRALGVSEIRLKSQLLQWLDLSLNEKVPPSLLLLSRALYLPDSDVTSDQLKATIASLPESVVAQTRDAISQRRGKIDNEARILAVKLEEAMIEEERKETAEKAPPAAAVLTPSSASEMLADLAPAIQDKAKVLTPASATDDQLTSADVAALENALESIGVQRKRLLIEKEELTELKEEMAEYQEDIQELKEFLDSSASQQPQERKRLVLRESKGARRLFLSVNRMIQKLDGTVDRLEGRAVRKPDEGEEKVVDAEEENVSIEELIASIRRLQSVENSAKLQQIVQLLGQIDQDCDGVVKVDDLMKVIELLSDEKIQMSSKQMTEILNLVNKEEILEMEGKVEKALGQAKIAAAHAAAAAVNVALRANPTQTISAEKLSMEEDLKSREKKEEENKGTKKE